MRIALILSALLACLSASAQEPVTTPPPASLDARDFGALGDGKADDTAAIQQALDTAGKAEGGIVWLPRGNYRVATHLVIPDDVTLQGIFTVPTAWSQMKGTTLLAEEGRGSEEGPAFIVLNRNSTLKGLTIYYPGQLADDLQPFPWTVASAGGDNASIVDVLMVNPFRAVNFASGNSGRHYIRNLYGQPLRVGISVDKCFDVGRIENVHFWPFWTWGMDNPVGIYMRENAEAFIFGRTDWEYVLNTFVFGYKTGYRFIQTPDGSCNGNFLGIGADATNVAVQVDQCQGIGLLITNGECVSFLQPNPTEVVVNESSSGLVQFNNCAFWGPADQIARIKGTGSVSFNQCHFMHWNSAGKGQYAIECEGGDLSVSASRFATRAPGVKLGPDVRTAAVFGNFFAGKPQIVNESSGDVQVGLNTSGIRTLKLEGGVTGVDDLDGAPAFTTTGAWTAYDNDAHMAGRAVWAKASAGEATATWTASLPESGRYEVYVFYGPDPNHDHATDAPYTVTFAGGRMGTGVVDQTKDTAGWRQLGAWDFVAGEPAVVTVASSPSGSVMADAVKFVPRR